MMHVAITGFVYAAVPCTYINVRTYGHTYSVDRCGTTGQSAYYVLAAGSEINVPNSSCTDGQRRASAL
jgi:hypothetical protein